jgi:hypothetical protein
MNTERYACLKITQKPTKVGCHSSETKEDRNKLERPDDTPVNFYIKHFFKNCQIKKLQPIFVTFVPPCIFRYRNVSLILIPIFCRWY